MQNYISGERVAKAIHKAAPFFSFIIGLGISVLLFHRNFLVMKTPALPLNDILDRTVKVDGKCYKYRVEDATCEFLSSS
jgi:hypothetical protein